MDTPEFYESEARRLMSKAEGDSPLWVSTAEDMALWQGGLLAQAQIMATLATASAQNAIWNELTNSAALA